MKLGLGIKDFERDFRRGVFMLAAFCIATATGFLLGDLPTLVIVEIMDGRFDDWIWLGYLSGAILGVKVLGFSAEFAMKIR